MTDADRTPLPILSHDRDLLLDEAGAVDQDYRFIDYDFSPMGFAAWGRMYLDDTWDFAFRTPGVAWRTLPDSVREYLSHRFDAVKALGPDGYHMIWSAADV